MEHAAQLAPNDSLLAQLHAEKCFFSLFLFLNAQLKENGWLANSLQTLSVRKPALPTSMCLSKSLCLPSMHRSVEWIARLGRLSKTSQLSHRVRPSSSVEVFQQRWALLISRRHLRSKIRHHVDVIVIHVTQSWWTQLHLAIHDYPHALQKSDVSILDTKWEVVRRMRSMYALYNGNACWHVLSVRTYRLCHNKQPVTAVRP